MNPVFPTFSGVMIVLATVGFFVLANARGAVAEKGELSTTALQAKINSGGPKLILRTSGGNIRLGKMS